MSNRQRRVGASILLIAQIYIFGSLVKIRLDPVRLVARSLSWLAQVRLSMLASALMRTQSFVASYGHTGRLSSTAANVSIAVAIFVDVVWLVFALTLIFPCVSLAAGFLSASCIALKDLLKTLIMAHIHKQEGQQDTSVALSQQEGQQDASVTLSQQEGQQDASVALPQQAAKTYAFERGWSIEKLTAENLYDSFRRSRYWWFDNGEKVSDWGWGQNWFFFYWVLIIRASFYITSFLQYVLAIEFCGLVTTLYTLFLLVWMFCVGLCIAFFSVINMLYMRIHHIYLRCPACYKEIALSIYLCPSCQMEHTQLRPGTYGVLWQRCSKCATKLPTLDVLGRKKLTCICPHCHHTLNSDIGKGTDIHIAIVGAAATGKTTYLLTTLYEFLTVYPRQYTTTVTFTDEQQQKYVQTLFRQLQSGEVPRSTHEVVPQAYTVKVQEPLAHVPHIVYLYDAGEQTFASDVNSSQQEYYRYVHGIIFIIDPLTLLPALLPSSSEGDSVAQTLRPGYLEVMQVYERMLRVLESSNSLRNNRRYVQPVAVVMTKIDACHFDDRSADMQHLLSGNTAVQAEAVVTQQLVRKFLATHGLDSFIRDIESHFASVEYFACSAVASLREPQDVRPMPPLHVLQPLVWILKHTKSLK